MAKKKRKEKREELKQKWVKKYRLVVFTEDSFEEKFSFKLNRLNVFVFGGVFSILLIVFTSCLIVYTSLKEYIPGFESPDLKKKAILMNAELDTLQQKINALNNYTESMKPVLLGDVAVEMGELPYVTKTGESVYQVGIANGDSVTVKLKNLYALLEERNKTIEKLKKNYSFHVDTLKSLADVDTEPSNDVIEDSELELLESSEIDSVFRESVEREERFSIFGHENEKIEQVFVTPVNGSISQGFSTESQHYAVDIVTKENTPVKATADGMVIFSEWTMETGFVIVVLHNKNYVSIYKHNSKTSVSQGELVKAGQVIANVGSTGELSTGPHLHFEIWKDGYPLDPTNFMKF
ncbi:M23 family metallopeptidase [Ochrovirga pacifica]|uniref:M23 family metallopeptidase n=1 Tax=Ochrovirga pacifica TaxID=1042376 RepID=UPI000255A7C1|nr:M23 family metallopeptidase [Ochrovirga pacifica]